MRRQLVTPFQFSILLFQFISQALFPFSLLICTIYFGVLKVYNLINFSPYAPGLRKVSLKPTDSFLKLPYFLQQFLLRWHFRSCPAHMLRSGPLLRSRSLSGDGCSFSLRNASLICSRLIYGRFFVVRD